jgi:hypothetical protein
MTPCIRLAHWRRLALLAVAAFGLMWGGPPARAQAAQAADGEKNQSRSVIVQAPRRRQHTFGVPPAKADAYAAEAAKDAAWRKYRDTIPSPPGPCPVRPSPGAGCGALEDGLQGYPGLLSNAQ